MIFESREDLINSVHVQIGVWLEEVPFSDLVHVAARVSEDGFPYLKVRFDEIEALEEYERTALPNLHTGASYNSPDGYGQHLSLELGSEVLDLDLTESQEVVATKLSNFIISLSLSIIASLAPELMRTNRIAQLSSLLIGVGSLRRSDIKIRNVSKLSSRQAEYYKVEQNNDGSQAHIRIVFEDLEALEALYDPGLVELIETQRSRLNNVAETIPEIFIQYEDILIALPLADDTLTTEDILHKCCFSLKGRAVLAERAHLIGEAIDAVFWGSGSLQGSSFKCEYIGLIHGEPSFQIKHAQNDDLIMIFPVEILEGPQGVLRAAILTQFSRGGGMNSNRQNLGPASIEVPRPLVNGPLRKLGIS